MNKYKKLTINTIIVFLGTAGSKLISFIMLPFYTKYLSVGDYGTTDSINTYVSLLLGIVTMCMADAIFIFSNQDKDDDKKKYFSSGMITSFIGLLICSLVFAMCKFFFRNSDGVFIKYIWSIFFLMLSSYLQSYLQNFLKGLNKLVLFSLSGVFYTIFLAIFAICLIPYFGVMGYVYSIGLGNIISVLLIVFLSKSYKYIKLSAIKIDAIKDLLKYSLPLIPNSIMWWLLSASNRPIMEKYVGLDGIGLYAIANKLPSLIVVVFSIFINSLIVSILEEYNKTGFEKFYNVIFLFIFSIQILVSSILSVFGSAFIKIITSDESYWSAWKFIPLLSLSVIFANSASFLGCTFSVTKKTQYYFYSSIFGAGTSIICNMLFINYFGVMGACISVLCSNLVLAISRLLYSYKYVKLKNLFYYFIIILLFSLLCFFVIKQDRLKYIVMAILLLISIIQIFKNLKGIKIKNEKAKN